MLSAPATLDLTSVITAKKISSNCFDMSKIEKIVYVSVLKCLFVSIYLKLRKLYVSVLKTSVCFNLSKIEKIVYVTVHVL